LGRVVGILGWSGCGIGKEGKKIMVTRSRRRRRRRRGKHPSRRKLDGTSKPRPQAPIHRCGSSASVGSLRLTVRKAGFKAGVQSGGSSE
jgi:hypothetical protein